MKQRTQYILGMVVMILLCFDLAGCDRGETEKGRACWGVLGMDTLTGEQCEPVDEIVPPSDEDVRNCCAALIPSCHACKEGLTVRQWLDKTCGTDSDSAEYSHWDTEKNEPVWLCRMVIID